MGKKATTEVIEKVTEFPLRVFLKELDGIVQRYPSFSTEDAVVRVFGSSVEISVSVPVEMEDDIPAEGIVQLSKLASDYDMLFKMETDVEEFSSGSPTIHHRFVFSTTADWIK